MTNDEERLWNEVYAARTRLFEQAFGPMPDEVYASWNFPAGAWPGGCLVQIASSRRDEGYFTSTFGLTNPGIRDFNTSIAGWGYEIIACTKAKARWPLKLLHAVATRLLQTTFTFLPDINRFGGSFIDKEFVVVPGFARVPRTGTLPNGTFQYLAVLPLTPEEHSYIHARPMVESIPSFLGTKSDEWIDGSFIWKR